ncbi:20111_t:CDS:1, partial [Gigaspora rosea]
MAHINYTNSLRKTKKLSQNSPSTTSRSPKKLLSWFANENNIHILSRTVSPYKNMFLSPTESPQHNRLTHFLHKNYNIPDRPKPNNDIYNNQPSRTIFTDNSNGQSFPTPINGIYNNQPLSIDNIHKKRFHQTLINDIQDELHDAVPFPIPPTDDNSNNMPTSTSNPKSSYDDTKPSHDDTKPSHDDTKPPHDDTKPSHDDTKPSHDNTTPSHDNTTPSHDNTTPSHDDTKSSHDNTKSSHDNTKSSHDNTKSSNDDTKSSNDDTPNTPNVQHTLTQTQPSLTQDVQPNTGTQNPDPVAPPGLAGNLIPTQSPIQPSQTNFFPNPFNTQIPSVDETSKNSPNITPSPTDDGIKYQLPSTTAGPKLKPNVAQPQIIKSPDSNSIQPYQPYSPPSISPTTN